MLPARLRTPLGNLSLLLLIGLLCCQCSKRASVAIPAPVPETPPIEEESIVAAPLEVSVEELPPPAPPEPPPPTIDELRGEAQEAFANGQSLLKEGHSEKAWVQFEKALNTLKNSRYAFSESPELESTYYLLLDQIQEIRLVSLFDPEQLNIPFTEATPLEVIADLNLYMIEVDHHLWKMVNEDLPKVRFSIPVRVTDSVVKFLEYYQNNGRYIMEDGLRRSGTYLPLFRSIFSSRGLPIELIYLPHIESLFKPNAYSRAHARGLWQFTGSTGRLLGLKIDWWIDERSHVVKSTYAAASYLQQLYDDFGDWELALAAYNGGPGRIRRLIRRHGPLSFWEMSKRRLLPRETRNFVPSFIAALIIYQNPARYGFDVTPEPELDYDIVTLTEQVDLAVVSELIQHPEKTLRELNPELRRSYTPQYPPEYGLKVPKGAAEGLQEKLAALPPEKLLRLREHRVRSGETLWDIANKYRTSITAIAQSNRIRNVHRIRNGQVLAIPIAHAKNTSSVSSQEPNHRVRRGDTLTKIARRYGVSIKNLLDWNQINAKQLIHPGQTIRLQPR